MILTSATFVRSFSGWFVDFKVTSSFFLLSFGSILVGTLILMFYLDSIRIFTDSPLLKVLMGSFSL